MISLSWLQALPRGENRELTKMLRLLQMAYREILTEAADGERTTLLGKHILHQYTTCKLLEPVTDECQGSVKYYQYQRRLDWNTRILNCVPSLCTDLRNVLWVHWVRCVVLAEGEKVGDDNKTEILFDRLMLIELRGIMSKLDPKAYAELRSYHEPPKVSTPRAAQGQYTTSLTKVSTPRAAQGQYTMSRPRSVHHELPKVSTPRAWPRSVYHEPPKVSTPWPAQGQYTARAAQGQYIMNCPRSVHHEPPKVSTPWAAQGQYTTSHPRSVHHNPPKVSTPRATQGQYTTSHPRSVHQDPPKVSTPWPTQGQYTMSRPSSVHHEPPKVSTPQTAQGQYTTNYQRSVHHEPPKVSTPWPTQGQYTTNRPR